MSGVVLYSYFRSSASWRVRIALAHKGIDYEYRAVNLLKSEQKDSPYLAMNPKGEVPTLCIDDINLSQSLPILEYLEETRPEKPLLPKDPKLRAECRRIAELVNSGIQPLQNLSVQKNLGQYIGNNDSNAKWSNHYITQGFKAIETLLQKTAGRFCVGDDVSFADLCLVPQIYNANRYEVDMSQFPIISRVHAECVKLDAFIAADPKAQPDCPENLK